MKATRLPQILVLVLWSFLGLPAIVAGDGENPDDKKTEATQQTSKQESDTHDKSADEAHDGHHSSRLTSKKIPLQVDAVPNRPRPLIEWGEPFLGTGTLAPGFRLPTGAVWQPTLIAFGTVRSALQSNGYNPETGDFRTTEVAARLDLFANLQLSGSERLVFGMRNLDQNGRFTSYVFDSDTASEEGGESELNADVESLFFEGDFGEIFPNISPQDFLPTDVGFSIGRQPIFFQEGMLINDTIDGIGLTLNSLQPRKTSNFRSTFLYAWNNVDRFNINRDSGDLFALFNSFDFPKSTIDFDIAFNNGGDNYQDLFAFGLSAVQRIGKMSSSFRVLGSSLQAGNRLVPLEEDKVEGVLLFSELSWIPKYTHNHLYFNSYVAIDTFTPVAMGPGNGGPLGRVGINFANVGLGRYSAPLSASASNVAGGALGYQIFSYDTRQQWLMEVATRIGTESAVANGYAATLRYQLAMGQRFVLVVDGYTNHIEGFDRDLYYGGRVEIQARL